MGGRGSSGGGGGGGGGMPKLQPLTGSEKQVKWANDIRESAFRQLDMMDANFDRHLKEEKALIKSQGYTYSAKVGAENLAGYNKTDVQAAREALTKAFNSPQAKSASAVIEKRGDFSSRSIIQSVRRHAEQRKRKR